jgi:hypothetical protein
MADQSAARRTADAQRGNAPQPRPAVHGGRQHPNGAGREARPCCPFWPPRAARPEAEPSLGVSSVAELTAAVGDSAVDKILVAAGTYDFTSDMCYESAICIDRAVTIEAQVPGSVVLDAKGGYGRRSSR